MNDRVKPMDVHSPKGFLLLDTSVVKHAESTLLGLYSTLGAARYAVMRDYTALAHDLKGHRPRVSARIEHRQGSSLLGVWVYTQESGGWMQEF